MHTDQFTTARLLVHSWRPTVDDLQARQSLEDNLSAILSDRVLEHLPSPLQLDHQKGGLSSWIDARAEESQVLLVSWKHSKELIGLMILACDPSATERPSVHVGYLLAETTWGQGIASELLGGLVAAVRNDGATRLIGGVGRNNPASARVLQKANFVLSPDMSTTETDVFICDVE
jgi:RimJ/RimL family protein N-acetyltransferase